MLKVHKLSWYEFKENKEFQSKILYSTYIIHILDGKH